MKTKCKHIACWSIIIVAILFMFVLITLGVNYVIGATPPFGITVYGKSSDWLNYLGVIISTIISAVVTFIILYITIKDNKDARSEQFRITRYQLYLQTIANYKCAIKEVVDTFKHSYLTAFCDSYPRGSGEHREKLKKNILDSANMVVDQFKLTFSTQLDNEEEKFLVIFENMSSRYISIVDDLSWLADTSFDTDEYDNPTVDSIIQNYKNYQNKFPDLVQAQDYRVWNVLSGIDSDTEFNSNRFAEYANNLILNKDISGEFYQNAIDFIKYENNKALKILNGTEQTK